MFSVHLEAFEHEPRLVYDIARWTRPILFEMTECEPVDASLDLSADAFEAIRRHGVTGLHLARGERSMLDAFQIAAKSIADEEIGVKRKKRKRRKRHVDPEDNYAND